jgi:large subunit ribosomal protein L18
MASRATYEVAFRRRREGKTDFHRRLRLLKGKIPVLVARVMSKNVIAEVVQYSSEGDKTLVYADSHELTNKYGWKGHPGNTSAAYLTGFLCGVKAKKSKVSKAVADIGLTTKVKGAAVFAVIKGAADAGLEVPYETDILPSEDRIRGKHTKTSNFDETLKKVKAG